MKFRPILFNTQMVEAILSGWKKTTRRAVKCKSPKASDFGVLYDVKGDKDVFFAVQEVDYQGEELDHYMAQPAYVGDVLWVRETWSEWTDGYVYRAWKSPFPQPGEYADMKWHPSILMPRDAARIFLEVIDVTVEPLQRIDGIGAMNEGIQPIKPEALDFPKYWRERKAFSELWDSTINPGDLEYYGWMADPFVWVISFKVVEKPKDF